MTTRSYFPNRGCSRPRKGETCASNQEAVMAQLDMIGPRDGSGVQEALFAFHKPEQESVVEIDSSCASRLADKTMEALAENRPDGRVPNNLRRQVEKLQKIFSSKVTVKVVDLARAVSWPSSAFSELAAMRREAGVGSSSTTIDVEDAFNLMVRLHTKGEITAINDHVLGQPRAMWLAGEARMAIAKEYESGVIPQKLDRKIDELRDLFMSKSQISCGALMRRMGWPSKFFRGGSGTLNDKLVDADGAFQMLVALQRAPDFARWDRAGETIRRVRKNANHAERASQKKTQVAETERYADSRNVGPHMAELMEAGERFFYEKTGVPRNAPMSEEARREFDAMVAEPLPDALQGTETIRLEPPEYLETSAAWYEINWYEGFCEISLRVIPDDGRHAVLVDSWIRDTGTKSRDLLPGYLKTKLHALVYEDGGYEL